MDSIMSKLRNLDAYPKINEDFYSRTLSGGVITLASSVLMLLLFFSELRTPLISLFAFNSVVLLCTFLRFDTAVFQLKCFFLRFFESLVFGGATGFRIVPACCN